MSVSVMSWTTNTKGDITGRATSIQGYTLVKIHNHRLADHQGYVREHRLIWEEHHKACLLYWADVHHINGDRKDNRIENLIAMTHGTHARLTNTKDKSGRFCSDCNSTNTRLHRNRTDWYKHPLLLGWICYKCYMHYYNRRTTN